MTSALIQGQTVLQVFDGPVPNPLTLGDKLDVCGASVGWTGAGEAAGYAIVPARYDTPPLTPSEETGRSCAIVNGEVQITRIWRTVTPPIPSAITNAQARYALMQTPSPVNQGRTLFDDVNSAITAAGGIGAMAWEYSNILTRDSPLVAAIATQAGLSSAQIDALFTRAAAINF